MTIETIPTLALTQPWATLVMIGAKKLETRSWRTDYTGPLGIHAAKGFPGWAKDLCVLPVFRRALAAVGVRIEDLPLGKILGTVTLEGCVQIVTPSLGRGHPAGTMLLEADGAKYTVFEPERTFGDYTAGRYAWKLSAPRPLSEPVPWRGSLGLFKVPAEVFAT